MFLTFTPEELEELRRFDAEIDVAPMEYEDYLISDFVEALLFPERERERAKRRERERRAYERDAEKQGSISGSTGPPTRKKRRPGSGPIMRPTGGGYLPSSGNAGGEKLRLPPGSGRPAGPLLRSGNGPMIGNISAGGGKQRHSRRGLDAPAVLLV